MSKRKYIHVHVHNTHLYGNVNYISLAYVGRLKKTKTSKGRKKQNCNCNLYLKYLFLWLGLGLLSLGIMVKQLLAAATSIAGNKLEQRHQTQ